MTQRAWPAVYSAIKSRAQTGRAPGLNVSPALVPRALRLLKQLLTLIDEAGWAVEFGTSYGRGQSLYVVGPHSRIPVLFYERRRFEPPIPKAGTEKDWTRVHQLVWTGELGLTFTETPGKGWHESSGDPFDARRLPPFMTVIRRRLAASATADRALAAQQERWARQQRQERIARLRAQREEQRAIRLRAAVDRWAEYSGVADLLVGLEQRRPVTLSGTRYMRYLRWWLKARDPRKRLSALFAMPDGD